MGTITTWSDTLQSTVDLLLALQSPAIIYCGPELITLYNDAYRPILGVKHPGALGRPVREVWSEVWTLIGSDLEAVMQAARGTQKNEALIPILVDGQVQDFYFNYSFSPLFERGMVSVF